MIYTKLLPHQQTIKNFIMDKTYFGIFAKYGSGKTLCALSYIEFHKIKRSLIVSTKTSINTTWVDEIKKHTDFKYVILSGTYINKIKNLYLGLRKTQTTIYNKGVSTIFLINFDGVKSIFNELIQANFDFICVDESTKIKSHLAMRTKVLWKLREYIDKRCIMTGFPVTENIADLYSQIKFLDIGKSFGNSYHAFINTYFTRIGGYKFIAKKNAVKDIVNKIKEFCIVVENPNIKLPPNIHKIINIGQSDEQYKLLKELNETYMLEFKKVKIDTEYIFALISRELQICNGYIQDKNGNIEIIETNKDEILLDLIEEIGITNNKIIIWVPHLFAIKKLSLIFKKYRYNHVILTGKTKNEHDTISKFQNNNINLMLATQKKASESITLTNCNYAIYYGNTWSGDEKTNSEARICRIGSEKHENIYYIDLITKNSREEDVFNALITKKNLVDILKNKFTEKSIMEEI